MLASIATLAAIGWPASVYQHGLADMPQFWLAPRTLLEGRTPYELWDWPYPLWTAVALLPLGLLALQLAAPVWLVGQIVAAGGVLAALGGRLLRTTPRRDAVLLFGIALAMQPVWLLVGGGNMTGLLFAAQGGALLARLAGRPLLAGLLLGLLVTKPLAFVISAPLLALVPRAGRSPVLLGAAGSAGLLVASSFLLHPGWFDEWTTNAAALQTSTGSNATGWTIARSAPVMPPLVTSALTIALALGALVAWWRARRPDLTLLMAAAIPVSLYVAPHGWSYDQLHLLITYAVVLELLARVPEAERIAGLLALTLIAVALPWALYARAVFTGTEDAIAIVPLLAFALVVIADRRASRYSSSASPLPPL